MMSKCVESVMYYMGKRRTDEVGWRPSRAPHVKASTGTLTKIAELSVHVSVKEYVCRLQIPVHNRAALATSVALVHSEHQLDENLPYERLVESTPAREGRRVRIRALGHQQRWT